MKILVTGAGGQLAVDLAHALSHHNVTPLLRRQFDITNFLMLREVLDHFRPDIVVNTAAFHKVDVCESDPEQSFAVNAAAPQRMAAECHRRGIGLVHFSTDYVFDGASSEPYRENDLVHPLSVYGASKAAGEMAIRAACERHLIVRTTGLYGVSGAGTRHGNFVETMLRVGRRGTALSVVNDQILTPTSTRDVARAVRDLVEAGALGTFHVTNQGQCSWFEFACEIFRLAGISTVVHPTTQAERPAPACRPAYSVLAHDALRRQSIALLPDWHDALQRYMADRTQSVA